MAVLDEISRVHARFSRAYTCAVTAKAFNCACARTKESVSLLLQRHWETMSTPMRVHTCILCVNLPYKIKISRVQLPHLLFHKCKNGCGPHIPYNTPLLQSLDKTTAYWTQALLFCKRKHEEGKVLDIPIKHQCPLICTLFSKCICC